MLAVLIAAHVVNDSAALVSRGAEPWTQLTLTRVTGFRRFVFRDELLDKETPVNTPTADSVRVCGEKRTYSELAKLSVLEAGSFTRRTT